MKRTMRSAVLSNWLLGIGKAAIAPDETDACVELCEWDKFCYGMPMCRHGVCPFFYQNDRYAFIFTEEYVDYAPLECDSAARILETGYWSGSGRIGNARWQPGKEHTKIAKWIDYVDSQLEGMLENKLEPTVDLEDELYGYMEGAVAEFRNEVGSERAEELQLAPILMKLVWSNIPIEKLSSTWLLARATVAAAWATGAEPYLVQKFCDERAELVQYQYTQESKYRSGDRNSNRSFYLLAEDTVSGSLDWPSVCHNLGLHADAADEWKHVSNGYWRKFRLLKDEYAFIMGETVEVVSESELFSSLTRAVTEWKLQGNDQGFLKKMGLASLLEKLVKYPHEHPEVLTHEDWILAKAVVGAAIATNSEKHLVESFCLRHGSSIAKRVLTDEQAGQTDFDLEASVAIHGRVKWRMVCPVLHFPNEGKAIWNWNRLLGERVFAGLPTEDTSIFRENMFRDLNEAIAEWKATEPNAEFLKHLLLGPVITKLLSHPEEFRADRVLRAWAEAVIAGALATRSETELVAQFCKDRSVDVLAMHELQEYDWRFKWPSPRVVYGEFWDEIPVPIDWASVCPNLQVGSSSVSHWRVISTWYRNPYQYGPLTGDAVDKKLHSTLSLALEEWVKGGRVPKALANLDLGCSLLNLIREVVTYRGFTKSQWIFAKAVIFAAVATNSEKNLVYDFCGTGNTRIARWILAEESEQVSLSPDLAPSAKVDWDSVCPNLHFPKQGLEIWNWNLWVDSNWEVFLNRFPSVGDSDRKELIPRLNLAVKEWIEGDRNPIVLQHLRLGLIFPELIRLLDKSPRALLLVEAFIGAASATKNGEFVHKFCLKYPQLVQKMYLGQTDQQLDRDNILKVDWPSVCPDLRLLGLKKSLFRERIERIKPKQMGKHVVVLDNRDDHVILGSLSQLFPNGDETAEHFKDGLFVKFVEEAGQDVGGLTREYMSLLLRNVFQPPFFSNAGSADKIIYTPDVTNLGDVDAMEKRRVGQALGLALQLDVPWPVKIGNHFIAVLLGRDPVVDDYKDLDDDLFYNFLVQVSSVDLSDEASKDEISAVDPDFEVVVTETDRKEYLARHLESRVEKFRKLGEELIDGFENFIQPLNTLPESMLSCREASEMFYGTSIISPAEFKEFAESSGGVSPQVLEWFWEIVHKDLTQEELRKLLFYITGSSGLPIEGFAGLKKKIQIKVVESRFGDPDTDLPQAATCSLVLRIPVYSSIENLRGALREVIKNPGGFNIV